MLSDRSPIIIARKRFRSFVNRIRLWFGILCVVPLLASCATSSRLVDHGFEFDIRSKDATVEIMDYRYGSSGITGTRRPEWASGTGRPAGSSHIFGAIPVGDELFVEWRIKATGELIRQTVLLRPILPQDLDGYIITFTVNERLLEVFVISPERRPTDFPIVGPTKYNERKAYQVFPINDLPKRLK